MSKSKDGYTCTLTGEHLQKAQTELNEDPETRRLEVQTLRERLARYPGLNARVETEFLLKFLRPRKFDQERTFKLVLNYYQMKKDNEDIYAEMTPVAVRHFLDAEVMYVLPEAGKNNETVVIFKAAKWDPESLPIEDVFKSNFLFMSAIIESEKAQVNGVQVIYDLDGFTWSHIKAMTPSMAQKFSGLYQDTFPVRVKGVHHVNEPGIFDVFFAVIKPFLKEKLTSRLVFHGHKVEQLHDFIKVDRLPEEYKGTGPALCCKAFNESLLGKQKHFEDDAKYGFVHMTIKHTKKTEDAMENLSGTFKKLNTD